MLLFDNARNGMWYRIVLLKRKEGIKKTTTSSCSFQQKKTAFSMRLLILWQKQTMSYSFRLKCSISPDNIIQFIQCLWCCSLNCYYSIFSRFDFCFFFKNSIKKITVLIIINNFEHLVMSWTEMIYRILFWTIFMIKTSLISLISMHQFNWHFIHCFRMFFFLWCYYFELFYLILVAL